MANTTKCCRFCGEELQKDLVDSDICDKCYLERFSSKRIPSKEGPHVLTLICYGIGFIILIVGAYFAFKLPSMLSQLNVLIGNESTLSAFSFIPIICAIPTSVLFFALGKIIALLRERR